MGDERVRKETLPHPSPAQLVVGVCFRLAIAGGIIALVLSLFIPKIRPLERHPALSS